MPPPAGEIHTMLLAVCYEPERNTLPPTGEMQGQ